MKLEPVYKSAPVVREGEMHLYGRGTSPDGKALLQAFSKHIVWLRESETRIRLTHGGALVSEEATYVDSGSYLTSVASAVERALALAGRLKVSKSSTLLIEAVTLIFDTPVLRQEIPAGQEPVAIRDWNHFQEPLNRYYRVGHPWWTGEIEVDTDSRVLLESTAVADEQVIWSSSMTPAISLKMLDEMAFLPGVADNANLSLDTARQRLAAVLGIPTNSAPRKAA